MNKSIKRQDAGGPLAVCLDGRVIDLAPSGADYLSPEGIAALRGAAGAELGLPEERFEILVTCAKHPKSSAVDCLDCEPLDSAPNPTGGES